MKVECGRCEWTYPTSTPSSHPPLVSHTRLTLITVTCTMSLRGTDIDVCWVASYPGFFLTESENKPGFEALHCFWSHLSGSFSPFHCRLHEQNLPPKYRWSVSTPFLVHTGKLIYSACKMPYWQNAQPTHCWCVASLPIHLLIFCLDVTKIGSLSFLLQIWYGVFRCNKPSLDSTLWWDQQLL